jgi:streptomycin 6-kinase
VSGAPAPDARPCLPALGQPGQEAWLADNLAKPIPVAAGQRYQGASRYDGPLWKLPLDLVVRAGWLMRELCASAPRRTVLHRDLHDDNILRGTREPWLAIDPHGPVGDPGYEVGALLHNPEPEDRDEALTALVPSRVEQFADELAMPVERVVAWGFVKAVLSDVWSAEGWSPTAAQSPVSRALDVARLLFPRLP